MSVYRYVLKRLLLLIPIIVGVTFIVFFILDLTPGDPGRLLLGPLAPQEAVDRKNEELGYNNPFFTRYLSYMSGALRGDFGESYRTSQPVFSEILPRFPTTLTLAFLAVVASVAIGIPLGILSAVRQYSKLDTTATISAMFVASVPDFWLGLMLMLLFSLKLRLLPPDGIDSPLGYIMPTLALALPSSASILRLTRTTMLETIRQDYIRTAKAKGASEKSIIWKHALKNALEGLGTPATYVLNDKYFGYSDKVTGYDYDPEKAVALLEEAGYPDGLNLTLTTCDRYSKTAQVVQEQLGQVGINLEMEQTDQNAMMEAVAAGDYTISLFMWSLDSDADSWRYMFKTGDIVNYAPYSNPEVDELFVQAQQTTDSDARVEIYNQLFQIISDDAVMAPIFHAKVISACAAGLDIGEFNVFGYPLPHSMSWN